VTTTGGRSRHNSHRSKKRDLPAIKEEKPKGGGGGGVNVKKQVVISCAASPNAVHKKKRRRFHYDYREVFLKSNVPQLIATLSGRIVVWNEFFLMATGLSERDAKRLTIFGIVQSNQLSNLYKMVARALAADERSSSSGGSTSASSSTNNRDIEPSPAIAKSDGRMATTGSNEEEWQAITLKCVPFPQSNKNSNNDAKKKKQKRANAATSLASASVTHHPHPLFITVALMEDEDRDQRCFHCILTDCCPPASTTNGGKLGSVTPELFAMLFTPSSAKNKKKAISGTSIMKKVKKEEEANCGGVTE